MVEATEALCNVFSSYKNMWKVAIFSLGLFAVSGAILALLFEWFLFRPGIIHMPNASYDFIIVGAGTAGCVLAHRLSENTSNKVILIEAGGDFGWLSRVPMAAPILQGTENDWQYRTVPQTNSSWGLKNGISFWPRGRGLGGSGMMNYMVHQVGMPSDFESWEKGEAWSFKDLEFFLNKAMRGLEVTSEADEDFANKQHSAPRLRITRINSAEYKLARAFIEAGMEIGFTHKNSSFQEAESTIHNGQRWSTFHGYLSEAIGRSNLHVLPNTLVTKIVFSEGIPMRSVGVEILHEAQRRLVIGRKEVVVCAGAVESAKLLLLSGIGPREHLQELGIPVVADLPVGKNLHDHLNVPLYFTIKEPASFTMNQLKSFRTILDYLVLSEGPLSSSGVLGLGHVAPATGLLLFGMGSTDEDAFSAIANFKQEVFRSIFPNYNTNSEHGFVLLSSCLKPKSRGSIKLINNDAQGIPVIDPQYLAHPDDISCMIEALKIAVKLGSSEAFKRLGAEFYIPKFKECEEKMGKGSTFSDLECLVRTAAITGYHPGGTCKMGDPEDETNVVDWDLRVKTVSNLRVVDASIMPTPVSGAPNSVVVAFAEKAAHLINTFYARKGDSK